MDSIFNVLADKNFDEPEEIREIKRYIQATYDSTVSVEIRDKDIILVVKSAALASRLRHDQQNIARAAKTDKRLVFRINN